MVLFQWCGVGEGEGRGHLGGMGENPQGYLITPVQQHPGGRQHIHGVQIEGPGWRVVWGFRNFLFVRRDKETVLWNW